MAHFSNFPAFYPEMIGTKKLDDAGRNATKEAVKTYKDADTWLEYQVCTIGGTDEYHYWYF